MQCQISKPSSGHVNAFSTFNLSETGSHFIVHEIAYHPAVTKQL